MRKVSLWLLPLLACAGLAYAYWVEPERIEITHHTIGHFNESERSIRVVQLSDLHLQTVGPRERAVAAEVIRLKPDLIVLSGDVIDRYEALDELDSFLYLLKGVSKVAVLGNWEYWADVDLKALRAIYEGKHGGKLLVNAHTVYRFGARSLQVLGLDEFTAGQPDINVTSQEMSGLRLVVQHSPGFFRSPHIAGLKEWASLCLSGHTHGGQVTLFGFVLWTPRGSGGFTSGLYDLSVCPLYVSRGIGTSILPIRLGSRPEIAVFTL